MDITNSLGANLDSAAGPAGITHKDVGYKVGLGTNSIKETIPARLLFKKEGSSERRGLFFGIMVLEKICLSRGTRVRRTPM